MDEERIKAIIQELEGQRTVFENRCLEYAVSLANANKLIAELKAEKEKLEVPKKESKKPMK